MGARCAGAVLWEGHDLHKGHNLHAAIREWRSITRAWEDSDTGAAGYVVKKKEMIVRRGRRGYSGRVSGGGGAKKHVEPRIAN
jgi:hypothetical protein